MATRLQQEIYGQIFHCAESRRSELLLLPFCHRLEAQVDSLVRGRVWHHVAEAGGRDGVDNCTRALWMVEDQAEDDTSNGHS